MFTAWCEPSLEMYFHYIQPLRGGPLTARLSNIRVRIHDSKRICWCKTHSRQFWFSCWYRNWFHLWMNKVWVLVWNVNLWFSFTFTNKIHNTAWWFLSFRRIYLEVGRAPWYSGHSNLNQGSATWPRYIVGFFELQQKNAGIVHHVQNTYNFYLVIEVPDHVYVLL